MFDNNLGKVPKAESPRSYFAPEEKPSWFERNKIVFLAVVSFLAVVIVGYAIFKLVNTKSEEDNIWNDVENKELPMLPSIIENENNKPENEDDANSAKAEYLAFADFYEKREEGLDMETTSYALPINTKIDVSNYYEVSRKIDLDKYIKDLDKNGFAVVDNPFVDSAGNFFSAYSVLRSKDVPVLITGDFLIYYYQNALKEAFKEIEGNIFYKEIWNINKKFFEIADARYKERFEAIGVVNDPILEAQRLEAAYFATALELLKPRKGQTEETYASDNKFSLNDTNEFYFVVPEYLQDDVNKEAELILLQKGEEKSPVFRYVRNYKDFIAPLNYSTNAKLNNFYLATRWMNSVFPLYYSGDYCPECLLPKEDWAINMITASYVSEDFSRHQDLKNRWARIYKVVSFFAGLRQELTYLHYDDALEKLFGENYEIARIFASDNPDKEGNILALQKEISALEFSGLEGGFDRSKPENRKYIGMRMLQEAYWPNDYIFEQLVSPNVGMSSVKKDLRQGKDLYISGCTFDKTSFYRCRGLGVDLINLIDDAVSASDFFLANSDYVNYEKQSKRISDQLAGFDKYSWHNNNFWNTMNIADYLLANDSVSGLNFTANSAWKNKNINTALGSWVNLQLPADIFANASYGIGSPSLSAGDYDYIEPNLYLAEELIANIKMMKDMFLALGVLKETDFSLLKLEDLRGKLERIKVIMVKELKNEALSYDDKTDINNIISQYMPKDSKEKTIKLNFSANKTSIIESIAGVKFLIVVYEKEGRKYLSVGPTFNYKESLK